MKMKLMQRTLALALALIMLIGMFTVGASAEDRTDVQVTINYVLSWDTRDVPVGNDKLSLAFGADVISALEEKSEIPDGYQETSDTNWYWLRSGDPVKPDRKIGNDESGALEKDFTVCKIVEEVKKEEPTTYTIKFDKNSAEATGTMVEQDIPVGVYTALSAEAFDWDGYRFIGWCINPEGDGYLYEDKEKVLDLGSVTLYAQWEKIAPSVVPPTPITPAVPNSIFGKYCGAVKVICGSDHHDTKCYDFNISSANQVTMVTATKAVVYLSDSDISTILAKYNDNTNAKHAFISKVAVALTLEYKPGFWLIPGQWVVTGVAELPVTCECTHCDCCIGWWHKHTITYTDGVKNEVVFKDVVKTVKHGAKTPTIADPVRKGYIFTGWTPKVASKATKCVIYTATWKAAEAPSLTKEHVAYLKGYGKGLVKPEGEITRAEAITMLYRLMDSASAKKWYTPYNNFSDVAKDAWYNDAVSTLANAGILRSSTGLLNPNEKITRAEFFYMLTGFTDATYSGKCTFTDVAATHWAYDELALAQYLGWVKGYGGGVVYPDDTISRAEVAAVLNRVLDRDDCKTKDTKNFVDNPVNAWYYQDIVEASISH